MALFPMYLHSGHLEMKYICFTKFVLDKKEKNTVTFKNKELQWLLCISNPSKLRVT